MRSTIARRIPIRRARPPGFRVGGRRVDLGAQGLGLGSALVKDAMLRAHHAAETVGARALLVHAQSATARDFYMHLAEFEPSPTDPPHLILPMADIEAILGE
jgi:GNAT superfamily N-acetyltransferase